MQITCFNCKNTWEVPTGTLRAARLMYALGQKEYKFTCQSCGEKSGLTAEEFHSYDQPQNVVPVTATQATPGPLEKEPPSRTEVSANRAPTNPVEAPLPGRSSRQAIVRARGVEARRDHSNWAEVMGSFHQGEKITIVDTWTDGENHWIQLGPERWINVEQEGEPVIELIDD